MNNERKTDSQELGINDIELTRKENTEDPSQFMHTKHKGKEEGSDASKDMSAL